ncbi:uncharacterized protein LOC125553258 isoform X2 [Triticum urartu]|uniref:uncharacterized protein LOC125553258 isoform X2 n=1 Tax=Triticum urartu TaxID=4572 RepID=UPI002044A944|nr:uncharacterized protein LOC125553258 isoform X2 [Triticum urartu]
MRESPRICGEPAMAAPTLATASHQRGRTTPLPRSGVSAATAGDEADHLFVLQSAAPFDGGVASMHDGAATSVFGRYKRCRSTTATNQRAATSRARLGGPRRTRTAIVFCWEDASPARM